MKFSDIEFNTPYCANFYGNSIYEYCFLYYGEPNTISGAMESIIEQFTPFNHVIEVIGSDITTFDGSNPTYVPLLLSISEQQKQM